MKLIPNRNRLLLWLLALAVAGGLLRTQDTVLASVTLSDFRTASGGDHVTVLWETGTELNNLGFYVWRGRNEMLDEADRITNSLIPSQAGGQATGAAYSYGDFTAAAATTYYYWLEAVDTNDSRQFEGPVQGSYGSQQTLATPTSTGGQGSLPTSTPAPTGTTVPTGTPPPTSTPRPSPTATAQAPVQPTMTQPAASAEAAAPSATPPPAPTLALEAGPTLEVGQVAATASSPPTAVDVAAAPSGAEAATVAEPDVVAEEPEQQPVVIGSDTVLPRPTVAPESAPSAPTPDNGLSPFVWAGLVVGTLIAVLGGGILFRMLRRADG